MLEDLVELRGRARRALAANDTDQAERLLLAAIREVQVPEADYASVVELLADVCARRDDPRGALAALSYLAASGASGWDRCAAVLPLVPADARGRVLAAMGQLTAAAEAMGQGGRPVAAAIFRERAGDWAGAAALWGRLARGGLAATVSGGTSWHPSSGEAPPGTYEAALVECSLARCASRAGDTTTAHAARVMAVHLLEEAADGFEEARARDRAFDCFQVLAQTGRDHGSFEDVIEGLLNCARILREDRLHTQSLHLLEEAIGAARAADELTAAATLAREAREHARFHGAPEAAARFAGLEARLWREASRHVLARGDPPQVAESALLSAAVALADAGRVVEIGSVYAELGTLDLGESRRAYYARAACRYAWTWDEVSDPVESETPAPTPSPIPDVWHFDLLEWERRGSASECFAEVLLGHDWAAPTRRLALIGCLAAARAGLLPGDAEGARAAEELDIVDLLGRMQTYVVLSPLEELWRSGRVATRLAVLSSLQRLLFRRSFVIVREAVADPDPRVVDRAAAAIESLDFAHAFEPLSGLLRDSPSPRIRASAIVAMAHIDTPEAAELVLDVLEHGAAHERHAATRAALDARTPSARALARARLTTASPAARDLLRRLAGDG